DQTFLRLIWRHRSFDLRISVLNVVNIQLWNAPKLEQVRAIIKNLRGTVRSVRAVVGFLHTRPKWGVRR
ncbi:hypothetical protein J7411_14930, partial [Xanthomonas phaseoli pv. dieffenbachiae]|uniref:hypothetical protein n=1 Tax=Xanthomonas citri TaxID=346 RepID=UPI001B09196E